MPDPTDYAMPDPTEYGLPAEPEPEGIVGQTQIPAQVMASVFANPEDLRRYHNARADGASEEQALRVGDNGLGKWGDDTTSTTDPMVALPIGTEGVEHGRQVIIEGPGGSVTAKVADVMSPNVRAKIDLNPAAAIAVGHNGGLTPVSWRWADQEAPAQAAEAQPSTEQDVAARGDIRRALTEQRPRLAGPVTADAAAAASRDQGDRLAIMAMMQGSSPEEVEMNLAESGGAGLFGGAAYEEAPQPPASAFGKYQYTDKDGAEVYSGGGRVYPDNSVQYRLGDRTFYRQNPYAKPIDISPRLTATQMQLKDGTMHKVLYDSHTGQIVHDLGKVKADLSPALTNIMMQKGISPYDDDGNELTPKEAMQKVIAYNQAHGILEPAMQREVQRITNQVTSSRNPAGRMFNMQYRNYLSAKDNVAIPLVDRTGMDDLFLLSAVAGIENPGRSNTQQDFIEFAKTKGIRGSAEVAGKRLFAVVNGAEDPGGGRLLSDEQVKNIGPAITRGMNSTYTQWLRSEQPGWNRLKQMGLEPQDYLPDQPMYTVPQPGKPGVEIPSPLSGTPQAVLQQQQQQAQAAAAATATPSATPAAPRPQVGDTVTLKDNTVRKIRAFLPDGRVDYGPPLTTPTPTP